MKKVVTIALIASLVAVPAVAFASHGADDKQANTTAQVAHDANENETENAVQNDEAANHDANDQAENKDATPAVAGATTGDDSTATASAVTEAQARTIAQAKMPGKTIEKVEKENEEGKTVFSVRFTDNSRVDVDASTGDVTRTRDRANDNSGHGNKNEANDNDSESSND